MNAKELKENLLLTVAGNIYLLYRRVNISDSMSHPCVLQVHEDVVRYKFDGHYVDVSFEEHDGTLEITAKSKYLFSEYSSETQYSVCDEEDLDEVAEYLAKFILSYSDDCDNIDIDDKYSWKRYIENRIR